MATPTYAVIIVTYQRDHALERTLEAVLRQSVGRGSMEICVINNGGAEQAKQRWASRVDTWFDSPHNLGCSGGRNEGARRTAAPVLVFIDDDGLPCDNFVESLGDVLSRHPDAVAVRGRAVALHHPFLTTMAVHYDRGPSEQEDLLTLEGGAAIRRGAWDLAGGYDESRAYHEGLELSLRLLDAQAGSKMMYAPHAVLKHDFFQGPDHWLRKAKMLAMATNRVRADRDPRLDGIIERAKTYRAFDGRKQWQKIVGTALGAGFKGTIYYYRLRARFQQRSRRTETQL